MKNSHRTSIAAFLFAGAVPVLPASGADRDRIEDREFEKTVVIEYSGTTASVANNAGVSITYGSSTSAISVASTIEGVEYIVSGTSPNGYLQITSTHASKVTLNGVSLASGDGPALSMFSAARNFVVLSPGTMNTFADGATYTRTGSGALYASGPLVFSGKGALSVTGVKSHAIYGASYIRCLGGDISVPAASKDAIHSKTHFQMDQGKLTLTSSGDGIDGDSGTIQINGGILSIRSIVDDTKGIACDGALTVNGGSVNMTVNGTQSKGLSTKSDLTVNGGVLAMNLAGSVFLETVTGTTTYVDPSYCTALKSDGDLAVNGGTIAITHTGTAGKGISADGKVTIAGGKVDITTTGGPSESYTNSEGESDEAESDCIKADGTINLEGGTVLLRVEGTGADAISSDLAVTVNAGILETIAKGDRTKGIKSKTAVIFNGGNSTFTMSGSVVLRQSATAGRYDPSYCTAIKSDAEVRITGGTIAVTHSGQAGKGISADGNVTISGGDITLSTSGANTASYTNLSGELDMAAADCLKADGNLVITGGTITASSTGSAADAISCDGEAVIGTLGNDTTPVITASTSGARILLSGSGMSADYANAKALKAEGNLTMNGGIYRATTSTNGAEGMESKATLTINGGLVEINSYDDAINAADHIAINGGLVYCYSSNNDGIDSNGTFAFSGGTVISSGYTAPEESFDCDSNTFAITGGTLMGTGGATSTPTSASSTQRTIIYRGQGTADTVLQIKNPTGTTIATYKVPRSYGGSPTGMTMLFSSPSIIAGTGYTIMRGGTVSGGTEFHGYYTGSTVTGTTSTLKTFNITGTVTTVQ